MKNKFFLYSVFLIFLQAAVLNSQTLFVDDFNYGPLSNLNGVNGWIQVGVTSPNKVSVVSPGLTFTGYQGSGSGNTVFLNNTTNGEIVLHNFATQDSGRVYYALMLRVDNFTDSATSGYNISLDEAGNGSNNNAFLYVKKVTAATFNIGVAKASVSASYSNVAYNTGTTYVAVVKYTFVPGLSNDSCKLYVFTSGIPSSEPVSPAAFVTAGFDNGNFGQVMFSNAYISTGLKSTPVRFDGLRIGTTWLGTTVTGLNQSSAEIPAVYSLQQNYPNPFNPSTNIKFSIPKSALVKLVVYDVSGREIESLVNSNLEAGNYSYDFNGEGLASGVYFYSIQTPEFSETKKMILIK